MAKYHHKSKCVDGKALKEKFRVKCARITMEMGNSCLDLLLRGFTSSILTISRLREVKMRRRLYYCIMPCQK